MTSVPITNEEQWRALRQKHVGCSEISALFNEHQQMTKYELWYIKKGLLDAPDLSDNSRVFWGTILEPAIADGAARLNGWNVRKVRRYLSSDTVEGFGGSLDYEIVSHDDGPGALEIKTADWIVAKNWEDGAPPLSYMLQLQGQLALTGREWGAIAVLIGGNDLRVFQHKRRPKTIEIIEQAVAEFWQSIRDNKPPPPDFLADAETIGRLHQSVEGGKFLDLSTNNRIPELCDAYHAAGIAEKDAEKRKDAAKAEILTIMGDAETAACGSFRLSAKVVAGAHLEYERKAYRNFRLTKQKEA